MDGGGCLQRKLLAAAKGRGPEGRGPWLLVLLKVVEGGRGKTQVGGLRALEGFQLGHT